ncbi:non-specific serine/threonine protein kinase [Ranunculus cassubicifolius]
MRRDLLSVFFSIVFLALVHTAFSVDQQFEACEPKNCGNGLNISYPFWIQNNHPDYCGYPGFRVFCKNSKPILRVSNSDYILQDIFYRNQSFLVIDTGAIDNSCPAPLHNFTITGAPFEFGQNIVHLLILYNCTASYSDEYPVLCNTDPSLHSFAMLLPWGEFDYSMYSSKCSVVVDAPVELDGKLSSEAIAQRNYALFLRNGFVLKWTIDESTDCLRSGGRCGFDKGEFVCFCSDHPHSKHCNNGKSTKFNFFTSFAF